jgi:hypothetical protein
LLELRGGQPAGTPSAGPVAQTIDTLAVVADDPLLDSPAADAKSRGDLRCGAAFECQNHRTESEEAGLGRLAIGEDLELLETKVTGDVHGGTPGC